MRGGSLLMSVCPTLSVQIANVCWQLDVKILVGLRLLSQI